MRAFLSAAALMALSCSPNAILELTVELPPGNPPEQAYAFVQISNETIDFDMFTVGSSDRLDGFLLTEETTTQQISVVAEPGDYSRRLAVRVRFCSDPRCVGLGDDRGIRERRLIIDRAFYELKRTNFRWVVPEIPEADSVPEVDVADRCDVGGCRDGTTSSGFCRSDGTHFCE
ncbi:MAG: hypothetical protein AAGE52_32210 [Myxococcota bacterium]